MSRTRLTVTTMLSALLSAMLALGTATPAAAGTPPLPDSMAAAGDSITRAFDSTWLGCLLVDCPQYSWSTGDDAYINSQYSRILALNPGMEGNAVNVARTGAKMADLDGQLKAAAAAQVQYVTILMGANDVCTSDVSTMTAPEVFRAQFSAALAGFFAADPTAHVYVSSLPNVRQLYDVLQSNLAARAAWALYGICQSALPPHGTDASREAVNAREVAFNAILQTECAGAGKQWAGQCLYDGGAGFAFSFPASDISSIDYFHPNLDGERDIAELTWSNGYWAQL